MRLELPSRLPADSVVLAFALAGCILTNTACITMATVRSAKSRHHHYASLSAVRGAALSGDTLIVNMDRHEDSKSKVGELSLQISVDDPSWGFGDQGYAGQLWCPHRMKVTVASPAPAVLGSPPLKAPAVPIPVEQVAVNDVCLLEWYVANRPPGISLISFTPRQEYGGRLDPPDIDHYPPLGEAFVVVNKGSADADTRVLYVPYIHERQNRRRYLYPLTPLTAAADVVTSPIQLVFLLLFLSGAFE